MIHFTQILLTWYYFSKKHFLCINIVLIILLSLSIWKIKDLKVNADWLSLFNQKDSHIIEYKKLIGKDGISDIFIHLQNRSDIEKALSIINKSKIEEVYPLKSLENKKTIWIKVKIANLKIPEQNIILNEIIENLDKNKILYNITGALQIIKEFNQSVEKDFIITGVITLLFVILVIFLFYGISPLILYGFFLQLTGLIFSLFFYSFFFKDINIITSTIPCILIGLGIDFVIHSITPCFNSKSDDTGKEIIKLVAIPMFWGALTTSIAFLSLCSSELSGLKSAGVLGGTSIICSYFCVILFIPAFSAKTKLKQSLGMKLLKIPFTENKKKLTIPILLIILILSFIFIPKIKFEEKLENLYDSKLPALTSQNSLIEYLGFYPTPLFLKFKSKNQNQDLMKLRSSQSFKINPQINRSNADYAIVNIIPMKNPFERINIVDIKNEVKSLIPNITEENIVLIGAPILCQKLNNLLLNGIITASIVVSIMIFFIIFFFFKSIRNAFSVLGILLLSSLLTLAFYGILNINLSIYTIILFPLFLGIGVDDCMHILYHKIKLKESLKKDSNVIKSIFLTTITTILGYGALIFAKNKGFESMGLAAIIGLLTCFFITIYILPKLINKDIEK